MTLLETMYIPMEGSSRFADLPIATNSIVKVCCMSLWMIVLLVADSWIISESRKTRFLNYLFDGILQVVTKNDGPFTSSSLRNTNVGSLESSQL